MKYVRMPIEVESPEEYGYDRIRYNLSESSVADQRLSDLGLTVPGDLLLLYSEHRGSTALRSQIVKGFDGFGPEDVLITGGAAGALFIIATALLSKSDHLIVVRPNYATNIETPRAIGCEIDHIDVTFENGFQIDLEALRAAVRPNTRIISVTNPHNPTGIVLGDEVLAELAAIAAEAGCYLLVDETYGDLRYGEERSFAASLGKHVITVSSLSKAYGIPGIRIGWLITKDETLQDLFLGAKEQISICGSVIDEWVAEQVLANRHAILQPILDEMAIRLEMIQEWIDGEPLMEWVRPSGGVVCFPRMVKEPAGGLPAFYERLLLKHGTYVGPGHWFEMPDTYFRLGYGWPTREELKGGLAAISAALRD